MYVLSRLFLMLSVLAVFYCVAVIGLLTWPASGWILAACACAAAVRKGKRQLTTLGSARWASEDDLRRHGLLSSRDGLIVGLLPWTGRLGAPFRKLYSWGTTSKQVCREIWSPRERRQGRIVRLSRAIHTAVFSPSGGGKGVSCVIPFLLTCPESCVVVDFKGENALKTATHRRKNFGHRIVLLDPFQVVTKTPDCFNPLDFIDKYSSTAIDECNDLANALVIRDSEERERHWNDSAEAWISAMLATVVQYG